MGLQEKTMASLTSSFIFCKAFQAHLMKSISDEKFALNFETPP